MLRRLIAFLLLLCGVALAGTAGFVYLYAAPEEPPRAAAIVVLSGPHGEGLPMTGENLARTERGVALWKAGAAPLLVMTGGQGTRTPAPAGRMMREHAIAAEVPGEAVLAEERARSTLQNALFTADLAGVDPAAPVILVTHRYHLPRAWASFRWAGFTDLTLIAADEGPVALSPYLIAEGVKWPLNALRAAGASLALALGAREAQVIPFLR